MRFADPLLLLLVLLLPFLVAYARYQRRRRSGALRFSDLSVFKKIRPSRSLVYRQVVPAARILALLLLVVAMARPQSYKTALQNDYTKGVDILVAFDVSGSMQAMDLDFKKRSRLDVAKEVTADFVKQRKNDRIGLVVFAGDAYTQCPMTLDHGVLLELLNAVSITMNQTIPDGTAIGLSLARCLKRLENSAAKSRVVVLITDGMNNAGEITPLQAANIARIQNVKVYTVGVGSRSGFAPMLVNHPLLGSTWTQQPVDIDEKTLSEIAESTGGRYYRAGDEAELKDIFTAINELETSKLESLGEHRFKELFHYLAILALVLLVLEMILCHTIYRVLP